MTKILNNINNKDNDNIEEWNKEFYTTLKLSANFEQKEINK